MKKLSKILILVLSVALICTGLILAVSAEGEAEEPTFDLKSAMDKAQAGDTIVMTGNAELSVATGVDMKYGYGITKSLTIDLNGYTINAPDTLRVFNMNGVDINFTVTGSGTINAAGAVLHMTQAKTGNVGKIIGTDEGITINHTGTATHTDGTTNKSLFIGQLGDYYFENLTVNTSSTGDNLIKVNDTANFVLKEVEINATGVEAGKVAVFYPNAKGTVSLNYCKVTTKGHSIFSAPAHTNKVENYIVVDNSYLHAAYGNGGFTSLIYNDYGNIGSDIVISNSYCSWNSRILINNMLNGTAITFKNCDLLFNGKGGSWFRSMNVKLEDGTRMWGNHDYYPTDTTFYSNFDSTSTMTVGDATGVYMIIGEGTRFDVGTYNKLMNLKGAAKDNGTEVIYYNEGNIVYPDGSTPATSETYKMIYDFMGDPNTPYVVVKAEDAPEVAAEPHTFLLYESTPYLRTIWHGTGNNASVTLRDGNAVRRWSSNGKKNSDGATPNLYFGPSAGILQSTYDVLVFDVDISADSANGFSETTLALHARSSSAANSGSGRQTNIMKISQSGLATASGISGGAASTQLTLGEWNHLTVVVDTSKADKGIKHVYVNGVYMGSGDAYTADDAYIFGIRFDITGAGTIDTNSTFILDNFAIRAFGDGTSTEALADNGESYLIGGGMAWAHGDVNDTFNVAGLSVNDVNEALRLNRELGLHPVITNPITHPFAHATENGKIYAGGNEMFFDETSAPVSIHYKENGAVNCYEVDTELANYSITYKYFLGTLESQLSNPDYWVSVEYKAGATPALYETKLLDMKFDNQGNGTYLYQTQKGWSTEFGATDVDQTLSVPLTAEDVKSHNGEEYEVYPVFNEGVAHKYNWLVKRADGSVRFAHTTSLLYGSDWTERGLNGTGVGGDGTAAVKLEYGETLVALTDAFGFASQFNSLRATKDTAEELVFNFDLNGHDILVDSRSNSNGSKLGGVFAPNSNETINIFSSVPGASVNSYGYIDPSKSNYNLGGGVFAFVKTDNAHINIGDVTVGGISYDGSNLTVMGDQIAQLAQIDLKDESNTVIGYDKSEGSSINISGCTLVRSTVDMDGMFNTRATTSEINVTDCTVILAAGGQLVSNNSIGADFSASVNFINSTIIMKENGSVLIGTHIGENSISFIGCVTNGKINQNEGKLTVEDTACYSVSESAVAPEGYVIAKYNIPMVIDAPINAIVSSSDGTKGAEPVDTPFVVVSNGSSDEADLVLPLLTYKFVPVSETVTVTWNGLGENEAFTETYAKGGNVLPAEIADYELDVLKLVANGNFDSELATAIDSDVTYTPEYDVVAAIEGLKANLSLYSDFMVNLYIPVSYAGYITEVNGAALGAETVTLGEAQYIKATVSKVAKAASDDAIFAIALTEGGYTATKTVSISIVDYASTILAGEYSDADKLLMYYMLGYVGEAALYFEEAADDEIAALLETYAEWNLLTVDKSYANALEDTGLSEYFSAAGIVLEDAPAFILVPRANTPELKVTVTYGDGNVRTFTVRENSIENLAVKGMKIYNFCTNLSVTVADANGVTLAEGTLNLDTYAKHHTDNKDVNEASAKALPLIEALYNYVKVAEAYKAETLAKPEIAE